MKRNVGAVLLLQAAASALLLCIFWSSPAQAYPWMIRHGYTACATCHADPSGGELLTSYGRVTADYILRMQYGERDPEADAPSPGVLWGAWEPPEQLLLSGSYRNLYIVRPSDDNVFTGIPVMQADLYGQLRLGSFTAGGSLGVSKVRDGFNHGRPAQLTTGQRDGVNMVSRTHYLGVDVGDGYTIRAGRLNLPYGVRIPEHTMWARDATRTDRESDQQHGLAVAYVGEKLRLEIMGIAGNYQINPDKFRERGYSLYAEGAAGTTFTAGISSKVTYAALDRITLEPDTLRQSHGIMARWAALETLGFLFEGNALFRTNADAGYVGFLQADYEPITGLHFMVTGELLDRGLPVQDPPEATTGLGRPKFGAWLSLDWFFYRQLEFRTDFVFRQDEPLQILGQLHMYL